MTDDPGTPCPPGQPLLAGPFRGLLLQPGIGASLSLSHQQHLVSPTKKGLRDQLKLEVKAECS